MEFAKEDNSKTPFVVLYNMYKELQTRAGIMGVDIINTS